MASGYRQIDRAAVVSSQVEMAVQDWVQKATGVGK